MISRGESESRRPSSALCMSSSAWRRCQTCRFLRPLASTSNSVRRRIQGKVAEPRMRKSRLRLRLRFPLTMELGATFTARMRSKQQKPRQIRLVCAVKATSAQQNTCVVQREGSCARTHRSAGSYRQPKRYFAGHLRTLYTGAVEHAALFHPI